ncbi:hypothetical protein [[Eubacterium] cellulosolvens]
MRTQFDDLDMIAFIVFTIVLISMTSTLTSLRLLFEVDPFIYNPIVLLSLIIVFIPILFISRRTIRIGILTAYIFSLGIFQRALHVFDPAIYSDVLLVSKESIEVMFSGGNIYLHIFRSSNPPGQPFMYGPFEPIFYAPFYLIFGDIRFGELFSVIITMILIFSLGRYIGYVKTLIPLTIYASWASIISSTGAGVNDDSAAMLAFLSIFLLVISLRKSNKKIGALSSIMLGISICFKLFPAIFVPFIVILLYNLKKRAPINWKYYLGLIFTTVFLLSLPYLLTSPESYLRNVFLSNANRLVVLGPNTYQWHIWSSLLSRDFIFYLPKLINIEYITLMTLIPKIMITIFLISIIVLLMASRRVISLARIVGYCVIAWFILLIFSPWFPGNYFAFIAPFVCTIPILDLVWSR